jgi:hypothetical protein
MRRRRPARDLRLAIDCLPLRTREAMLDGIGRGRIIVGGYTDRQGGVCPMLAAHRNGGRTSLMAFARAWDRYTGARRARPATRHELTTLRAMLEGSILDDALPSLRDVPRPRKRDHVPGLAWLRPQRRLDDYRRALVAAGAGARAPDCSHLAVAGADELELRDDAVAGSLQ